MARRTAWTKTDELLLVNNYEYKTIKELIELLPKYTEDSINSKIRRLKQKGLIKKNKDPKVIERSYKQRSEG